MFLLKVLKVLHLNIKCFITLLRPTKPQIKKTIKTSSKAALGFWRPSGKTAAAAATGKRQRLRSDTAAALHKSNTSSFTQSTESSASQQGLLPFSPSHNCWIKFVVFCDVRSLPSTWVESEMLCLHGDDTLSRNKKTKKKITPKKQTKQTKKQMPQITIFQIRFDHLNLYLFLNYSNPTI